MTQHLTSVGDIFFLCYIITQYLCFGPGRVAVPVDLVFSSASQGLTPLQRNTGKGFTEDHPPVTTNNQTQQQQQQRRRMEQKAFPFFSVFHLLLSLFHLWPHLDHLKTHLDVTGFCRSKKHSKATEKWRNRPKKYLINKTIDDQQKRSFQPDFSKFKPTPRLS